MPQAYVRDAVIKAVKRLPGYPRLKTLDLSCGDGEILASLHQDGCQVEGSHFRADDWIVQNPHPVLSEIPVAQNVNLKGDLPFEDQSFNLIILSEVMEHLTDHHTVIQEVGRVLKPGGFFVMTTPNVHRLHSRWRFFWTGTHKLLQRRVGWDLNWDQLYAYHINLVDFPVLHTLLHLAGMKIFQLGFTRFKIKYGLLFLLFPLIWLFTRLEIKVHRRKPDAYNQGVRNLFRWMVHPALLASEQLLVLARKG